MQQRPVTASLIAYVRDLPVNTTQPGAYDQRSLVQDLVDQASRNLSSNNVVVPVLQTFSVLLESDVFDALPEDPTGLTRYVRGPLADRQVLNMLPQSPVPAFDSHEKRGSLEEPSAHRDVHADVSLFSSVCPPRVLIADQSRQPSVDGVITSGLCGTLTKLPGSSVPEGETPMLDEVCVLRAPHRSAQIQQSIYTSCCKQRIWASRLMKRRRYCSIPNGQCDSRAITTQFTDDLTRSTTEMTAAEEAARRCVGLLSVG